ncbi:MAG: hypothetical protein Q8M47_04360, partial [Devosia sp.]|nr:hypothetical protein [Devosia sp.]
MNGTLFGSLPEWIGPQLRLASQSLSDGLLAAQFASASRMARKALGSLPKPRQRPKRPSIFGFIPHIVPDTEAAGVATGYWHKPQVDWQPSADLAQFLKTDRPVVVVGFSSIASSDPAKMHRLVVETAELAGCRIVYLSGRTQQVEADSHNDVLSLKDVPHSWLFPRVQAVVHHGG